MKSSLTHPPLPTRPSYTLSLPSFNDHSTFECASSESTVAHSDSFQSSKESASDSTLVRSSSLTYEKPIVLEKKITSTTPDQITKKIRFLTWFNPYRQLLFLSILLNLVLMLIAIGDLHSYMKGHLSAMVLGNLVIGTMARSEWILRFVYWLSIICFRWNWVPAKIKLWVVGVLYHIGGFLYCFFHDQTCQLKYSMRCSKVDYTAVVERRRFCGY